MVEVFKTNVEEAAIADKVIALLLEYFPGSKISFDLEDCDRILRIAGSDCCPEQTISLLNGLGYRCTVLN